MFDVYSLFQLSKYHLEIGSQSLQNPSISGSYVFSYRPSGYDLIKWSNFREISVEFWQ